MLFMVMVTGLASTLCCDYNSHAYNNTTLISLTFSSLGVNETWVLQLNELNEIRLREGGDDRMTRIGVL